MMGEFLSEGLQVLCGIEGEVRGLGGVVRVFNSHCRGWQGELMRTASLGYGVCGPGYVTVHELIAPDSVVL